MCELIHGAKELLQLALIVGSNDSANPSNAPVDEGESSRTLLCQPGGLSFLEHLLLPLWAGRHAGYGLHPEIAAWIKTNEIANWEWIAPSRAAIF